MKDLLRAGPFRRFQSVLGGLGPGFRSLAHARTVVPVVALDIVSPSLSIALFALALATVHGTGADLLHIGFTYAASQVVTNLTVLPGALGAYEGMMTGAMVLQGVTAAAAGGGALIYRVVDDVMMAMLGLAIAAVHARSQPASSETATRQRPT